MQKIRGIFQKPQQDLESIVFSVFDSVIPAEGSMEWQTPDLMNLLKDLYGEGFIDKRLMQELQLASNTQADQSDYSCTADPDCRNPPVWAHSTPKNILEDLAELADRSNAKKVYTITAKREGPQIELEVPQKTGAGFFSCALQEGIFQNADGEASLTTSTKQLQVLHGWKATSWSLHVLAKTSIHFERRNQLVMESWYNNPHLQELLEEILKRMTNRVKKLRFKDDKSRLIALSRLPKSFEDLIAAELREHQEVTQLTSLHNNDYRNAYLTSAGTIKVLKREVNASPRLACTGALQAVRNNAVLTLTVLPNKKENTHVALVTFPIRHGDKPEFRSLERLFNPCETTETEFQIGLSDLIIKTQNFAFRPTVYKAFDQSVIDRLESSLWINSSDPIVVKASSNFMGVSQYRVNLFNDMGGMAT